MGGLGFESRLTHSKVQKLNYCAKNGFIITKEEFSINYTSSYLKKKQKNKQLQVNLEPLPMIYTTPNSESFH